MNSKKIITKYMQERAIEIKNAGRTVLICKMLYIITSLSVWAKLVMIDFNLALTHNQQAPISLFNTLITFICCLFFCKVLVPFVDDIWSTLKQSQNSDQELLDQL